MKKTLYLGAIIIAGLAGLFFYRLQITRAEIGSLNIYVGEAEVIRGGKAVKGASGTGVKLNDELIVSGGGRVSIVLKDGSVVRLEEGTRVKVKELEYDGKKIQSGVFSLVSGRLWAKVSPESEGTKFEVETPSVVAAVRGTGYNTDYQETSSGLASRVYVYRNSVSVALKADLTNAKVVPELGWFVLRDNNLEEDFALGPVSTPEESVDDWIRFNQMEDDRLDGRQAEPELQPEDDVPEEVNQTEALPPLGQDQPAQTVSPPVVPDTAPDNPQPENEQPQVMEKKIVKLVISSHLTKVKVGGSILLKAQGFYSDDSVEDVGRKVAWQQNPELGSIKDQGYFTGVFPGTAKVKALLEGVASNELSITVEPESPKAVRLSVSYEKQYSETRYQTYQSLPTAQFACQVYYEDGKSENVTSKCGWSVSGNAGGSINQSGYYAPKTQGADTVSASFGGVKGSAVIEIP